ncbi:hypothetical protein KSW79_01260, partial [Prevotella copri]|uniref:hypothetical protein n=1 Tax=Segatella copri TaxID=165179 RepID=UPI001C37FC3E
YVQLFTHIYQLKLIPPTGLEFIKNHQAGGRNRRLPAFLLSLSIIVTYRYLLKKHIVSYQ